MDAMSYEFLLRRAYHCGRFGANGKANADIYRNMEHAERELEVKSMRLTQSDREYEYRVAASRIANNVSDAIATAMKEIYSEEDKQKLQAMRSKLHMQYDRKIIDEVIEAATDILMAHKLEPR